MAWLDAVNVIGLILAVLGIPSSYYAIRTAWKDFFAVPEGAQKLIAEITAASHPRGRTIEFC